MGDVCHTNGRCFFPTSHQYVIQMGGVQTPSHQEKAIFCNKSIAIQMGAVLFRKGLDVWGAIQTLAWGQIPGLCRSHPRGPVQIRHVLCFAAFRARPGPVPAHPGPILVPSVPSRIGPGRNRLLGHFRIVIHLKTIAVRDSCDSSESETPCSGMFFEGRPLNREGECSRPYERFQGNFGF